MRLCFNRRWLDLRGSDFSKLTPVRGGDIFYSSKTGRTFENVYVLKFDDTRHGALNLRTSIVNCNLAICQR